MIYDVIIIGLGPAGIAASIYAHRGGLNVLVLEASAPGGLINTTTVVNNYPGFTNISGPELAEKMFSHFKSFDIDYKNEDVIDVLDGEVKTVVTRKGEYKAKNVIIATGRNRRSLNLPGEKELQGRGISYCAMCDGAFYRGKDVALVGAGDSSLEEALYLSKLVNKATIIVRKNFLRGNVSLVKAVEKTPNIEIKYETNVTGLVSENEKLKAVTLSDGTTLEVEGLFVYIGFDPILPFKTDLHLKNNNGYIIVDENFETSIPGVYAVGDIIDKKMYQIISAAYEGAAAANSVVKKLTNKD